MTMPPSSIWFTLSEIAKLDLPGLPKSESGVSRRAVAEDWVHRTAPDGSALARRRIAPGGGTEYHASLLPAPAQVVLNVRRYHAEAANVAGRKDLAAWADYELQPAADKAEAERRLAIVIEAEAIAGAGIPGTTATASRYGVPARAITYWLAMVLGVPRADWLPRLTPQNTRIDIAAGGSAEKAREILAALGPADPRRPFLEILAGAPDQ